MNDLIGQQALEINIKEFYARKKCQDNIDKHRSFFDLLKNIEQVVVLGHSLSKVDTDYFKEIIRSVNSRKDVRWYISYYDKLNTAKFARDVKIDLANIVVFPLK